MNFRAFFSTGVLCWTFLNGSVNGFSSPLRVRSRQDQSRSALIQPRENRRILGSATSDGIPESVSYTKRRELLDAIDLYNINKKESFAAEDSVTDKKKPRGFLGAETKGAQKLEMNDEGKKIIELIEELALYNPTEVPLRGFLGYKEVKFPPGTFGAVDINAPNLGGTWKLRFTTASDATFKPGRRGPATTLQYVNSTIGTFTNIIEFRENKGKVKGFQVVVEGKPVNDKRINLTFRRVIIDRRSRVGLNRIVIPLPNFNFLQRFSRKKNLPEEVSEEINVDTSAKKKREGPHFNMLYLDDEMRIHKTGEGNYFVQTRLYDAWDPMKGWTLISAV